MLAHVVLDLSVNVRQRPWASEHERGESSLTQSVTQRTGLADPRNMPAMSDDHTTQDPPEQPQPPPEQPLVSDPEAELLLKQVMGWMGNPTPQEALRRSLQTVLAMYQSKAQGGRPIIRYAKTKTEQQINLPGAS